MKVLSSLRGREAAEAISALRLLRRPALTGLLAMTLMVSSAHSYEIEGKITVARPFPEGVDIPVKDAHRAHCGEFQASQVLIISEAGGLKNAVVWLEGEVLKAEGLKVPGTFNFNSNPEARHHQPFLNQKNCRFEPHIFLVPSGIDFEIANEDPMDHDVRIFDGARMLARFETPVSSRPASWRLDQPGIYTVRCGLHHWMHAAIVSTPHPFYTVTGEDGHFRLSNPDAGSYSMKIWHEKLGEVTIPVPVTESLMDFKYEFPSPNLAGTKEGHVEKHLVSF